MKLAIVIPWYGIDIPGGAEAMVCRIAENLSLRGWPVEVLTTCIRDFHADWGKNYHRPGIYQINGVPVHRFRVERRQRELFDAVNRKLLLGLPVSAAEERFFLSEMINSPDLYRFIRSHQDDYFFIFVPYLFSTTYWGSLIRPDHSCIIACLHDEPYARLNSFRKMFEQVRALIFLAPAEHKLATHLYNLEQVESLLIGGGVDTEVQGNAIAFQTKYGISEPFILYVGRRNPEKNTPLLLEYFASYKRRNPGQLKLVLIGSGDLQLPDGCEEAIIDLGFVSPQDKLNAYAAATVLCQPSVHESFSLVLMEAWVCGTPVLVHAGCEVTRDHCVRSNGGLYFADYEEFEAILDLLLRDQALVRRMGLNGRDYVLNNYDWKVIMAKYEAALARWGVSR